MRFPEELKLRAKGGPTLTRRNMRRAMQKWAYVHELQHRASLFQIIVLAASGSDRVDGNQGVEGEHSCSVS
jgi:hypothetical protein